MCELIVTLFVLSFDMGLLLFAQQDHMQAFKFVLDCLLLYEIRLAGRL